MLTSCWFPRWNCYDLTIVKASLFCLHKYIHGPHHRFTGHCVRLDLGTEHENYSHVGDILCLVYLVRRGHLTASDQVRPTSFGKWIRVDVRLTPNGETLDSVFCPKGQKRMKCTSTCYQRFRTKYCSFSFLPLDRKQREKLLTLTAQLLWLWFIITIFKRRFIFLVRWRHR